MIVIPGSLEERISLAVSKTIENFAFEEAVIDSEIMDLPTNFSEMLLGIIKIEDPPLGEMGLIVPKNLMAKFTEAIHGIPAEELTTALLFDNLAELLNTLAGRLVASMVPGDRTFMLGLPSTNVATSAPFSSPQKMLKFLVGEEFLILSVPETFWKFGN